MTMETIVYVIRHGETDWNAEGRLQGQLDIPLNDRGREQAHAAGEWIAANVRSVAAIITSDLSRASETASIIAGYVSASCASCLGASPVPLHTDPRLRETKLGVWQTRKWVEVEASHGHEVNKWKADPDWCMEGGETTRARFHRVSAALHDGVQKHGRMLREVVDGSPPAAHGPVSVIFVAHGGVIDDVGRLVLQVPHGKRTGLKKLNTSITVTAFDWSVAADSFKAGVPLCLDPARAEPHTMASAASAMPSRREGAEGPEPSPWRLVRWGVVDHLEALVRRDGRPIEEGSLASDGGTTSGNLPGDEDEGGQQREGAGGAGTTSEERTAPLAHDDVDSA